MILVSACLLGLNTKYNGESNAHPLLQKYSSRGRFVPLCPEQLGGLPTPREAAEIRGGRGQEVLKGDCPVLGKEGEVITGYFIRGAQEVLKVAAIVKVSAAILKERSPSCGVATIYDGSFTHRKIPGQGVTAALLKEHNIPVYSEEELNEEQLEELLLADQAIS